jgi:hypothetical protein
MPKRLPNRLANWLKPIVRETAPIQRVLAECPHRLFTIFKSVSEFYVHLGGKDLFHCLAIFEGLHQLEGADQITFLKGRRPNRRPPEDRPHSKGVRNPRVKATAGRLPVHTLRRRKPRESRGR